MPLLLSRLALVCYRHRRGVLLAWVALVVAAVTLGPALAGRWSNSSRLPGTDSQAAQDVLAAQFPAQAGESDAAVFAGIATHRATADEFLARLGRQPGVIGVGPLQLAPRGDIAYAPFTLGDGPNSHPGQTATAIEHLARPSGLTVAFSGDSFESGSAPSSEFIGVVAALVVLLVVFGSVLAAGLPIVIALAGIGVAIPLVGMAAHAVPTPDFTDQVAALIGIGVGIDYTLLVVTRYRAALARHGEPEEAVAEALSTAGRSVILAGSTVVVSLMGLFLMDLSTFDGLAVGTALAVLVVVAATLTLLPALLGFAAGRMFKRSRAATGQVPNRSRIRFAGAAVSPAWWGGGRWGWPRWEWSDCWSWPRRLCTFASARLTPAPTRPAAPLARPTTWPFGASARVRWGPSPSWLKSRQPAPIRAPLPSSRSCGRWSRPWRPRPASLRWPPRSSARPVRPPFYR